LAYATLKLPKNSVGRKQIKPNAVNSSKVKDGSLTGADINASSLGTVPNAKHADGADTVGGKSASDFAPASAEPWHEVNSPLGSVSPGECSPANICNFINVGAGRDTVGFWGAASGPYRSVRETAI
jgi:hypothetical protein